MRAIIGSLVALVLVVAVAIAVYVSTYNKAVVFEETIVAQHKQTQNILGQHAPKIKEALGVQSLAPAALVEVFKAANESRYGENGSGAAVQWIQEQNPNLDQSQYGKIIAMLEASRNDFMNAQEVKLDKVRAYRTYSRSFFTSIVLNFAGMPAPVLDKNTGKEVGFFDYYGEVVVSGHANKAFETGIDDGLDVGVKK